MRLFPSAWLLLLQASAAAAFLHHHVTTTTTTTTTTSTRLSSLVLTYTIDIDENAPRDVSTMEQWCAHCGVQKADGFQLTMSPDGRDVQAMTTQDLPAGQPVLFVPATMILRGSTCRQELGPIPAAEDLLTRRLKTNVDIPHFYIFLKLLMEVQLGTNSPWFPWLNSLPRYFSNGSSMTHFCCTECLPPYVGSLANEERIRFIQFYRALQEDSSYLTENTKTNRPLAKWAYAVVSTRSFPIGTNGDFLVSPMADMFNHGTTTEIQLDYDQQGNCYAYSTYDIPAGSPLRMSYGDPTNPSFLFARYGFLDETSPATFCKIILANPSQEIINMGYDHSKMLFYKDTGAVSQEVWDVLLYQVLDSFPQDQQLLYNSHLHGDYDTKQALHNQYFYQTKLALLNHVNSFLTKLDALSQKAYGRNLELHPRLPLIMSHNAFVRNTFLLVKSNLEQM